MDSETDGKTSTPKGGGVPDADARSESEEIRKHHSKNWPRILSGHPEFVEQFIRALPVMMHSIDRTGTIVYVSDCWLRLMKYERHEVVGRKSVDFLTPASREKAKKALAEFYASGYVENISYEFVKKSGEIVEVLLSASSEWTKEGEFVRSYAISNDVTAFNQNLSELRHKNSMVARYGETLEAILESMAEGVCVMDRCGNILIYNNQAKKITGMDSPNGDPSKWSEIYGMFKSDRTTHLKERDLPILRALRGEHVKNAEVYINHAGLNRPTFVSVSADPIRDHRGNIMAAVSVFRDITEEKKAAAEILKKSEELYRSNRELEQFAYVASHDLQAPVRHIATYVEILEAELASQRLSPDAQKALKYMKQGTSRVMELITELLDYSRIGHGKVEFRKLDLAGIISEVLEVLKNPVKESGANIQYRNLPKIYGNAALLRRLFQNLIDNSIKYRNKGVDLRIQIRVEDSDTHWDISVKDNGKGIDPRHADKAFRMFHRLSYGETKGTGIGLTICKKIAELHGGQIWIEPIEQGGTEFKIRIPKSISEHEVLPGLKVSRDDGKRKADSSS